MDTIMDKYIVSFNESKDFAAIEAVGGTIHNELVSTPLKAVALLTEESVKELEMNSSVKSVLKSMPKFSVKSTASGLTKSVGEGFWYKKLQIEEYRKRGLTGQGIKVAVVDSGCIPHNSIKVTSGLNCADITAPYMVDESDHGTAICSIICGQGKDGTVRGIIPDAELHVLKADSEDGLFYDAELLVALDYCKTNGIHLANISWGALYEGEDLTTNFDTDYATYSQAFEQIRANGCLPVTSAGNDGIYMNDTIDLLQHTLPSSVPSVIAVGNIDYVDKRSSSSSTGPALDFVAYGTQVLAATTYTGENAYSHYYGTSFAAPMVLGQLALYKQAFPTLTWDEIIQKAKDNSIKLWTGTETNNNAYGYGKIGVPPEILAMPITEEPSPNLVIRRAGYGDKVPLFI